MNKIFFIIVMSLGLMTLLAIYMMSNV